MARPPSVRGEGKKSGPRSRKPAVPPSTKGTAFPPHLLEMIPDATVAVDASGTIVQLNTQTEALFGYAAGELIGRKVELLVPQRFRAGHKAHRADYAGEPKIRRMGAGLDLYGVRKDGSEFPVEISLSPVEGSGGPLVLSAIRDITDRKRIEEELRRAHEELGRRTDKQLFEYRTRLAAIVDSSQDAIVGKDLDGIITAWNKGAERIYGYSAEEMIGRSVVLLTAKDRADEIPSILERIARGEIVEHYEAVRIAKDGRRLDISLTVAPIRDAEGAIIGASAIGRDITSHKRAEQQLRQAQKMEAIGRLAGGVAHDFNNILGIITACSELLRDRVAAQAGPMQYVDNIRKAAERGATLTRQLLGFSRQQVVRPRILDLNERLKEILKLLKPLVGDDVEIVLHAKAGGALVEIDPGQLDQIVLNLAVNARDAMPRGGRLILETGAMTFDEALAKRHLPMTPGRYVMLAVSDTGVGMDEATLANIFEPFFTTKDVGKGTGLGLATVYGIVRQSGGTIWVYSEPGRGTTFKTYLPSMEHKVGLLAESEPETAPPMREGGVVLLVEDDDLMRDLTKQILEEHGYTVVEARDGQAALAAVDGSTAKIDLLLTDVVMRGMSGPELVEKMRTVRPGMKAVYMSGYTGELIAEHDVIDSGIALVEKPFTRVGLLKAVDAALE